MNFLRQSAALLRLNLGGLSARGGSALTILIGVTCTVGVLVSMLAMGTGAHQQFVGYARDDTVVVTSRGSGGLDSSVSRDEANAVADLPGVAAGETFLTAALTGAAASPTSSPTISATLWYSFQIQTTCA